MRGTTWSATCFPGGRARPARA